MICHDHPQLHGPLMNHSDWGDAGPPLRHTRRFTFLWDPSDYAEQTWVSIAATQLDDRATTATQKRRILEGWIDLLSSGNTSITHLDLCSRVPQHLLDAVVGVHELEFLEVKWGPYEDLSPLSGLLRLEAVHLGGASRVSSLAPLATLPRLNELNLANAFRLADVAQLGELTGLRYLTLGADVGTYRPLHLRDLEWARSLHALVHLQLVNTIIDSDDYSPLLDLPHLQYLGLPLKRKHLGQIRDLAAQSEVFAEVAAYWDVLLER